MKKKILFALTNLLFLLSHAQNDPDSVLHQAEIDAVLMQTIPNYIDTCNKIGTANPTVVFIDNYAVALIELNNNYNGNSIKVYNSLQNLTPYTTINNPSTKFYLQNLPIDQNYIIKAVSNCGNEVKIGELNTTYSPIVTQETHTFIYDASIFNHISGSIKNNQSVSELYENVINDTAIPYLKKLNFIQRHLNKGTKFSSSTFTLPSFTAPYIFNDLPIYFPSLRTLDDIYILDDECICKIVGTIEFGGEDGIGNIMPYREKPDS